MRLARVRRRAGKRGSKVSLRKRPTVSEAMLAANRANARKSTGPRTAEGKARSRMNRFKHGGRSRLHRQLLSAVWSDHYFALQHMDLLFALRQSAWVAGSRGSDRRQKAEPIDPAMILRKVRTLVSANCRPANSMAGEVRTGTRQTGLEAVSAEKVKFTRMVIRRKLTDREYGQFSGFSVLFTFEPDIFLRICLLVSLERAN